MQAADPVVDFSERTEDQERRSDAVVALAHHRNTIDVGKHAVDCDHGIVVRRALAQRFVAARSQIHLVAAGRELFRELTSGFRVVLNDHDTAVTSRHGLSPDDRRQPIHMRWRRSSQ
jgi:hypothetical protein